MPGRDRAKADRKHRQMLERTGLGHKPLYSRCFVCKVRFQVNNYEDGKPRVNKWKFMGKIVCPWCKHRGGKQFVRLHTIAEAAAARSCDRGDECKCLVHSARRVLA